MTVRVVMTVSAKEGGGKTRMVNAMLKSLTIEYNVFDYRMTEFPESETHTFLASRKDGESDDRSEASAAG